MYRTADGRLEALDTYDPSGGRGTRASRRHGPRWLLTDYRAGRTRRFYTLAECREEAARLADKDIFPRILGNRA